MGGVGGGGEALLLLRGGARVGRRRSGWSGRSGARAGAAVARGLLRLACRHELLPLAASIVVVVVVARAGCVSGSGECWFSGRGFRPSVCSLRVFARAFWGGQGVVKYWSRGARAFVCLRVCVCERAFALARALVPFAPARRRCRPAQPELPDSWPPLANDAIFLFAL